MLKIYGIKVAARIAVIAGAIVKINHFGFAKISHFHKVDIPIFRFLFEINNADRRSVDLIVVESLGRIEVSFVCDSALNVSVIRTVELVANIISG